MADAQEPTGRPPCACGCGQSMEGRRAGAKFFNGAHRRRAWVPKGPAPGEKLLTNPDLESWSSPAAPGSWGPPDAPATAPVAPVAPCALCAAAPGTVVVGSMHQGPMVALCAECAPLVHECPHNPGRGEPPPEATG
jgi:hypothetical protein